MKGTSGDNEKNRDEREKEKEMEKGIGVPELQRSCRPLCEGRRR